MYDSVEELKVDPPGSSPDCIKKLKPIRKKFPLGIRKYNFGGFQNSYPFRSIKRGFVLI